MVLLRGGALCQLGMGKEYPRDFEVPRNTVHLVVIRVEREGGLDLLGQNTQHGKSRPREETLFQNKIREKMQAGKCAEVRVGNCMSHSGVCGIFQKRDFNRHPSEWQPAGSPMCLSDRPCCGPARAEARGRRDLGSQRGRGKKREQS